MLADRFHREGSFEKIQLARKWMRNCLIFQGYHELEWSEINVAWDVIYQDSADYAFPNNYYRSLVLYGVSAYIRNEPIIEPQPANDDFEAGAASKAAKGSLEVIKKNIKYDYLRVLEAINLRLMGNSFRCAYFSKDPRYGYATSPVFADKDVVLSHGGFNCQSCGPQEGGTDIQNCPQCQQPVTDRTPPVTTQMPQQVGTVKYPKGEIMTEIVNPLEVYLRSSSYDLWHAPFLVRNRMVDRLALQAAYKDINLNPSGDEGGGEAYAVGGDLGLIYMQSLADLPGDPTQFAAWYERASAAAKAHLVECWIRPGQYFFDKELTKKFPDGLYVAKTGDILLEARNDTIEDHWTHYTFIPVPGRIWGDGDDDLIPGTLKLDETDRLIMRNQGYNSSPILGIDSQRIDKNEIINDPSTIIEVKPAGKPVSDAFHQIESQPLSQESWAWRETLTRPRAPCTVPSGVRMKLLPRSKISCSRSVLLERPSCRMGTLAASYFRTLAGNIPGGIWRSAALHGRRHLSHRHVDLHVRMEVNPHHRVAVVSLRLNVFDVVYVGSEACARSR